MTDMKKIISLFLSIVLAAGTLTGCHTAASPQKDGQKLRIVTTIFPEYDWVREILGDQIDHVELMMLQDDGVDLHSFQPTADDMVAISGCDLFLYTGGESDFWVEDALAAADHSDPVVINLMEVLGDGVKTEEVMEGMQESEHHHHGEEDHNENAHEHHDEHGHGHEDHEDSNCPPEFTPPHKDEHIWLSLKYAAVLCGTIADALGAIDPDHKDTYGENAAVYLQKLTELDQKYQDAVDASSNRTLLFADRFPFRYLVDDYGLSYYAAFSGCSAETEASFETVAFLAGKVDELSLPCVLTIEGAAHDIARTVVSNTKMKNQKILVLNSIQSVTADDAAAGTTYLSIMEQNLETLKIALG